MGYSVQKIMDLVDTQKTSLTIEAIRQAFVKIATKEGEHPVTSKISIVAATSEYPLPANAAVISSVSILDSNSEYQKIPRLISDVRETMNTSVE